MGSRLDAFLDIVNNVRRGLELLLLVLGHSHSNDLADSVLPDRARQG